MGKKYTFTEEDCIKWKGYPTLNPRSKRYISSIGRNSVMRQLDAQCKANPSYTVSFADQKPVKQSKKSRVKAHAVALSPTKAEANAHAFMIPHNTNAKATNTNAKLSNTNAKATNANAKATKNNAAIPSNANAKISIKEAFALFNQLSQDTKSKLCYGVPDLVPRPPNAPPPARRSRPRGLAVPAPVDAREAFVNDALETFAKVYDQVLSENDFVEIEFKADLDLDAMTAQGKMAALLNEMDVLLQRLDGRPANTPLNSNSGLAAMMSRARVTKMHISLHVTFDTATIMATTVASDVLGTKRDVKLYEQKTTEDEQGAQQAATAYVTFMDLVKLSTLKGAELDTTIHNASKEIEDDIMEQLSGFAARHPPM